MDVKKLDPRTNDWVRAGCEVVAGLWALVLVVMFFTWMIENHPVVLMWLFIVFAVGILVTALTVLRFESIRSQRHTKEYEAHHLMHYDAPAPDCDWCPKEEPTDA